MLTNCHKEQFSRANDGKDSIDVFEDGLENIVVGFWRGVAFGVETWVNDAVHVEIEVVEFHAVRVWFT